MDSYSVKSREEKLIKQIKSLIHNNIDLAQSNCLDSARFFIAVHST